MPAHLSGCLLLVADPELGYHFLPFSLVAGFMGDPFPLHQLLHCIGVDYWSDWVAFVSPRVFLFHCLLPPETLGKKTKPKPDQLSLYPTTAPAGEKHSSTVSTLYACFSAMAVYNTTCCSQKGHSHFLNSLRRDQAVGTGPWCTVHKQHYSSFYEGAKGCQY